MNIFGGIEMGRNSIDEVDMQRERISKACDVLMEHCNSIQVMCSIEVDGGGTRGIFHGCGDYYSRAGMAHEFIQRDRATDIGIAVDVQRTDRED